MIKRFVLIDRDGTLNVEKQYLADPDQLELIPGSGEALRRLQDAGFGICLVTNQSAISRGYFDVAQLDRLHQRLENMVARFGVRFDGIYYCPHAPADKCDCRKPLPGMIRRAMGEHRFDPEHAWVIGDKEVDIELGLAVGARTVLVRTGYGKHYEAQTRATDVADDLAAAVELVLR